MKKAFKGILFIATGILIILAAIGLPMGFISELGLSFWDVLITVVGIIFIIGFIGEKKYSAIPFPLMVVFFFLEDNIALWLGKEDKDIINNWLVFGCTILISIGISMLGGTKKGKKMRSSEIKCGEYTKFKTRFGSASKYVDCKSFSHLDFSVSMGECILYFENSESYTGGGVLNIDCHMGSMEIHVPNGWHLVTDIKTSLAETELPEINFPDGPTLTIRGRNSIGDVKISYR